MQKPLITERKDLRTGEPVWLASARIRVPCGRRLPGRAFDVVIVGAGISGALVAHRLRRRGARVLVLDRRPPVHGGGHAESFASEVFDKQFPHIRVVVYNQDFTDSGEV